MKSIARLVTSIRGQQRRSQRGQAISILSIVLAVFCIGFIGVASCEIARLLIARDQLRTAVEAAALAASASLSSVNSTDGMALHDGAIRQALQVFVSNDVMGAKLNRSREASGDPSLGEALLAFRFLDPNNRNVEVARGDAHGKVVEITARYGLSSMFGNMLGLTVSGFPLRAVATGGANPIDIEMCFDISGSMGFYTPVSFVRRTSTTADPASPNRYDIAVSGGRLMQGRLDRLGATFDRAMAPQDLVPGTNPNFSPALRGLADVGAAGGDNDGNPASFTDLVVNIDGQDTFSGISKDGFDFPNIATVTEAARGNLESAAVFSSSHAALSLPVAPRAGYRAKYLELAAKNVHPLFDAKTAATDFFRILNNSTDARFGLVAFDHEIGTDSSHTFHEANVSRSYAPAGAADFPLPRFAVDADQSHFDEIMNVIPRFTCRGATALYRSFNQAAQDVTGGGRADARKAIVLFTDGMDTVDRSPSVSAMRAAQAKAKGVRLFCVGLSMDPATEHEQRSNLQALANMVGNGSKVYVVNDPARLKGAFSSIARELTQLVQ